MIFDRRTFYCCLALSCAWLWSCVTPQQMELVEREQKRLRSETTNTVSENASIRKEIDSVRSSLADTRANLQQVQRDLNAVKEKVEEVRYQTDRRLGQSSQEGDQRVKDLEGRLAKISEDLKALTARQEEVRSPQDAQKAPPSQPPPPSEGAGAGTEFAREKVTGESEAVRRDYEAASRLLEQKDYRGSINRFKEFVKKYPKSDYADNAQYWIGECYYALREFDQAILEFDAVRRNYPKGDKVPAALLKQGFAFAELGDKVDARLILQELINRYPQSPEAGRAKQKLKTLES
jgi:tol-pal system protein YbgF